VPQQHPVDRHLRPAATGGKATLLPPMPATEMLAVPSCQGFLGGLMAGNFNGDKDKSVLEAISNAILLRGERPEIRLHHQNGRVRVYSRQLLARKQQVKTSQINKRRAAARLLERTGGAGVPEARGGRTRPSSDLVRLSVAQQVGLVADLSMSHIGFNRWRKALGGSRSGLGSLAALRAHHQRLATLPGKQVVVTGSGAHFVSLTAAVQEKVTALFDADLFVKRPAIDTVPATTEAPDQPGVATAVLFPGSPPNSAPDVQITLGLDKGCDPGSVKIVASIINQAHPNSPSNTILVAVCPCDDEKYDELSAMLETHLPQIDALLRDGVIVHGARRPVRLILGFDYAAQCGLLGHKGATATQPCLMCRRSWRPSGKQAVLDALFGTLQDLSGAPNLRERTHFADRMAIDDASRTKGEPGTADHHCLVARSPLIGIDPRIFLTITLHTTQGVHHRLLPLSVEMVMVHRGETDGLAACRQAGAAFAHELAGVLHEKVRVRPTAYHGGLFIGRDCHTIGDNSALVCAAMVGKAAQSHGIASEEAWRLWNRVRRTLNRAATIPAEEVSEFRADTAAMVTLLKGNFGWLSISPKLHILMSHAPDFLERWGSIGLYGEQGLEAWHGRYGQGAVNCPGETEVQRETSFMRSMALAREAGAEVLARYAVKRKRSAVGVHEATKAGDKRRREN